VDIPLTVERKGRKGRRRKGERGSCKDGTGKFSNPKISKTPI